MTIQEQLPEPGETGVYHNLLKVDVRALGLEMLLCPFPLHNSSPRSDMFAKQLTQVQMLVGAEMPMIFTGFEHKIGEYEFDTTERDQDVEILAVIPKYRSVSGIQQINDNPTITVIYLGLHDRKLHYFNINKYTKGTDGYGYYNVFSNTHRLLEPGTLLRKDEKLTTSPIHNGAEYNLGVNVNTAYITLPETIEDAILISESLAKRMESRSIRTISIKVSPNQHPLNLYGDEDEFKFLPDIGETVNQDGILCGFRTPNSCTFISDTLSTELTTPHHLHDKLYRAPAGAVILDIEFHINRSKVPAHLYSQIEKYVNAINRYYQEIIEVYRSYKDKYDCAGEMNSLVTRAFEHLSASDVRIPNAPHKGKAVFVNKDIVIDFLQIDITYTHPIKVQPGFKMTGRDGNKGVVSAIWPDEDMPIDDFGIRADMCIDPTSGFNRMNCGQWYEQYINRVAVFVQRTLIQNRSFDYVMEFLEMINPVYANTLRTMYATHELQQNYVNMCIERGIHIHIPPGLATIDHELPIKLDDKYHATFTPITYNLKLKDGSIKRIRTKNPICLGSKYIYLLYKMPESAAAGISYVNQFKTPIRPPKSAQLLSSISQTPIRFGGEDEIRILTNGAEDPSSVARLMCLQANSPEGVKRLIEAQLTAPKPSCIDHIDISNETLMETNTTVGIMHHMMETLGIESRKVRTNGLTKAEIRKYFSEILPLGTI